MAVTSTTLGTLGTRSTAVDNVAVTWTTGVPMATLVMADMSASPAEPTTLQITNGVTSEAFVRVGSNQIVGNAYVGLYYLLPTIAHLGAGLFQQQSAAGRKYFACVQASADASAPIISQVSGTGGTATHSAIGAAGNLLVNFFLGFGSTSPGSAHNPGAGWTTVFNGDATDGGGQGKCAAQQQLASGGDLTCAPTWDTLSSSSLLWMAFEWQETAGASAGGGFVPPRPMAHMLVR